MKIDRSQADVEYSRGNYVRKALANRTGSNPELTDIPDRRRGRNKQRQPEPNPGSVDLYGFKNF